jgi:hypothetical protein
MKQAQKNCISLEAPRDGRPARFGERNEQRRPTSASARPPWLDGWWSQSVAAMKVAAMLFWGAPIEPVTMEGQSSDPSHARDRW